MGKPRYFSRYYEEDVFLNDNELYDLIEQYEDLCRDRGQAPEVTTRDIKLVKRDQSKFDLVYFNVRDERERKAK